MICTKHRKILLGSFYRPPNSPPASMLSIETYIGLALDTTINDVICKNLHQVGKFKLSVRCTISLTSFLNLHISKNHHLLKLIIFWLQTNITYFIVMLATHSLVKILDSIAQYIAYLTLIKQLPTNMTEKFGFMKRKVTIR